MVEETVQAMMHFSRLLAIFLFAGPALAAEPDGLAMGLTQFRATREGDMGFVVTFTNASARDFCALTYQDLDATQTFRSVGGFEMEWPKGDLFPIVDDLRSKTTAKLPMVVIRMRAGRSFSFPGMVYYEDFYPAPVGDKVEVRWKVRGFWCDEMSKRFVPAPIDTGHYDYETGGFRHWPKSTIVTVTSEWRAFAVPPG